MKVVFIVNCAHGKKGETKEVADGFAKNFLFPKKLATPISANVSNELSQQKQADKFHYDEEVKKAYAIKRQIEELIITKQIKFGDNGKAFGSITNKEISEELDKKAFKIDKKKIELKEPIKSEGTFMVKVKLFESIEAKLKIVITK